MEKILTDNPSIHRLNLHIPAFEELRYRQKIMQDPKTMKYNRGYDLDFEGYNKETGCIDFPESEWREWYEHFIGQEPERFYAYIKRLEDGAFIGEVNLHKSSAKSWHEMGIVIEAKHRGFGYAAEALELLLNHAFDKMNVDAVHNEFEITRAAAAAAHLKAGFYEYKRSDGMIEFLITKENRRNDFLVTG